MSRKIGFLFSSHFTAKEAKEKLEKLKQEKDRKIQLAFQQTKLEEKNLMKRGTEMEEKHKMELEKIDHDTEVSLSPFLFFSSLFFTSFLF